MHFTLFYVYGKKNILNVENFFYEYVFFSIDLVCKYTFLMNINNTIHKRFYNAVFDALN
jgi:hypothetical protein